MQLFNFEVSRWRKYLITPAFNLKDMKFTGEPSQFTLGTASRFYWS